MKGFYLLHVFRGAEVFLLPFASEQDRAAAVHAVYQGDAGEDFSEWDPDYDSLFALDVDELGRPTVYDFPEPDRPCKCDHLHDADRPHDKDCPARDPEAERAS